ncbi:hypothetical protein [Actinacidiphila oryziradicis]|uniref:hypothetical protein n=1 Tax=Actinacidiphila oryziradicis TaxID=2571141 RepID=UPI001B80A1A8|nr:hypothetical protein [Actinacidiphila oryziradicis]
MTRGQPAHRCCSSAAAASRTLLSRCGDRFRETTPHNIANEQAQACAAAGGGIGVTGVGIFLGPNDAVTAILGGNFRRVAALVRQ